jgi:hypothetical protein
LVHALILFFQGPLVYLGIRLLPDLDFRMSINLRTEVLRKLKMAKSKNHERRADLK